MTNEGIALFELVQQGGNKREVVVSTRTCAIAIHAIKRLEKRRPIQVVWEQYDGDATWQECECGTRIHGWYQFCPNCGQGIMRGDAE